MVDKELILIILGCLMVYVFLRIDEAKRKKRERQERLNRIKFD
jgi:putative Mn2+ efflux pump MntP